MEYEIRIDAGPVLASAVPVPIMRPVPLCSVSRHFQLAQLWPYNLHSTSNSNHGNLSGLEATMQAVASIFCGANLWYRRCIIVVNSLLINTVWRVLVGGASLLASEDRHADGHSDRGQSVIEKDCRVWNVRTGNDGMLASLYSSRSTSYGRTIVYPAPLRRSMHDCIARAVAPTSLSRMQPCKYLNGERSQVCSPVAMARLARHDL